LTVRGYHVFGELCRGASHVVLRGSRVTDGVPVLLKGPQRQPPPPSQVEDLRREFALLGELSVPGLPRAYELVRHDGNSWLVLEDTGAVPLASLLAAGAIDVATSIHLALQLSSVLGELHRREVIHGAIQPGNILVHPDRHELLLIDFAHATRGAVPKQPAGPSLILRESLAYVSPEQTGRMNRGVDHRTDLYSAGLTLYEMLTGVPAFRMTDPLELIHAHIAKTPPPPAALQPGLPEALSLVVMKLLEKGADDRYQSAQGLKADLETCAREWNSLRAIPPFVLGTQDVTDRFLIPHRLYGRDREVEELGKAFDRACAGPSALVLASGYSGMGKTSLIQELYRPIVRERGYFISGKFDQGMRNVPFGALVQAFRGLVQQLLTESEERLTVWRGRLETALGDNAGVLTDVIPEIELIIGKRLGVPPLAPVEAQNRFRLVFQNFVGAMAGRDHPLVVFLDDLQWADAASLEILHPLLTSPDVRHVLVIGAYRDNEVNDGHLLSRTVRALEASFVRIDRIELTPLPLSELKQLVADCLRRDDPEIDALARLVAAKTEGNPFFVIQFLKSLSQEGLLRFDHDARHWAFRTDEISRAPMTQNVIELMGHRIQRLPTQTQDALTLAACVGNRFDLGTLATVSRDTPLVTRERLQDALDEGLVLVDAETGGYAFLHDQVQQAAYARLPEESRVGVHLAIGRLLLETWNRASAEERVFDIAGHLLIGRALITDEAERFALAQLCRLAGERARTSTAYQAALSYFRSSQELLDESNWTADYPTMFAVHLAVAECEYLCGHFDEAELRFAGLLARAETDLDKAQVYELRVVQHENLSRYVEAARIGCEGLRLFGMPLPDAPADKSAALEAEMAAIERLRAGRAIESLVDLSVMGDVATRMVLKLLTTTWAPAYISGDAVLTSLISARIVRLSIESGNSEDSAYGYVTHAITVGPLRGDYQSAYEWGSLALVVNDRFSSQARRSKIHQQFNAHVTLWRRPLQTCIPHAREACRSGLQYGDFAYAGYGAFTESWPAFLTSRNLDRFIRDYVPTIAVLQKVRMLGLVDAHTVMLQWARALAGETGSPVSLSDEAFDEAAYTATHRDNPFFMTVFHVAKLQLAVLHDDASAAMASAREARRLGPWGRGTIWPVLLEFWGGLAVTSSYRETPRGVSAEDAGALRSALQALGTLADNAPENFRCFHLLLSGEVKRIEGAVAAALASYEDSFAYARETDSLQNEALSHDLIGRLFDERGHETAATAHYREAKRCYREWGAAAKVLQLNQLHPRLTGLDEPEDRAVDALDVASVVKAAHALAGEMVLEELLRKLMSIALENAGAERVAFITERDGVLVIEAEGRVGGDVVSLLGSIPIEGGTRLSRAVVQFVRKTGTGVVIGDALKDDRFSADPYVSSAKPRSILCVPVVHQGKFGGLLYLENNLTTGAFTAERIKILDVIASQAAISLENAHLYRERTQEIERRKRAEDELRAALTEVESLKNRLEAENVYLQEEIRKEHNFEEMVGSSPQLLSLLRTVERIAQTDSTVLIGGETGTGKELIARAIHDRSKRKSRPLVKVNCGAITAGLVESELFGHVKGAFTGAIDNRVGRFELAQGGTLFLDEVGELPPDTQIKLLRVLQEHEFEPVGGNRTVRVDVRVIAATNRDLNEAMRDGRFRSDLFYRLNVVPLNVPSLRDRRSDIPQLVAFFLSRFSRKFGKDVSGVSRETMDRLIQYRWPGNIRELQNVIERAVVLMSGTVLQLDRDFLPAAGYAAAPSGPEPVSTPDESTPALDEVQRRHILDVLAKTQGVIEGEAGAAKILRVHPNTLRSRMKKLGIRRVSHEIS
jgi:predicted ATPase/transcriptional regulator with GAF, ATPase, and Fis domain